MTAWPLQSDELMMEQGCLNVMQQGCWFGLNDRADEGNFVFVDGTPFSSKVYSNWYVTYRTESM